MSRWNLTQKTVRPVVPLALIDLRIAEGSIEAALQRCCLAFGRLADGGWGCRAFLSVQIFGQRERSGRALFHCALDRLLVAAQSFTLYRLTDLASFDVEQNLYLPWLERVTVHAATN